ncbi:MAG: hypothetical protein V1835_06720 [Candidatus Micrarchaeota archaeon]
MIVGKMRPSFKEELMKKTRNTPYREALSHVLLLSNIVQNQPIKDYSIVIQQYGNYSNDDIVEMDLLGRVEDAGQLKSAIIEVKSFISNTLGLMSGAEKKIYGGNEVFGEYVELIEAGFDAWSDVLADCEEFVDKIE